jgi:hypothetical protein
VVWGKQFRSWETLDSWDKSWIGAECGTFIIGASPLILLGIEKGNIDPKLYYIAEDGGG